MNLEAAVRNVSDYPSLVALLADHLDWEINAEASHSAFGGCDVWARYGGIEKKR